MIEQTPIGIADLELLIGKQAITIYALQKQLIAAQQRNAELEPKPEAPKV